MRFRILVLSCVLFAFSPARGQTLTPSMEADLYRLLKVTGSADLGKQMIDALAAGFEASLRAADPEVNPRAIEIVREVTTAELGAALEGPLMREVVQLYARHFRQDEVRQLIAFYETPLGEKLISKMPVIVQESMKIGQDHTSALSPRVREQILARLKSEGLVP